MPITLDDQITCIKREIGMRKRVYPKRVHAKFMTQAEADREVSRMEAVLATLESLALADMPGLFPAESPHE